MRSQDALLTIRAELCRRELYEFVKRAWHIVETTPYIDCKHIRVLCEHYQAVYDGRISNLLINIPPGCTKSLVSNVFFPAWAWANNPSLRFFHATYDARLSTRDSVKCRTLLESRWYQETFYGVVEFARGENQKTYYVNTAGGYRMATSVGGHGTGEHPHFIIADDPNNVKKAESRNERQAVEDWWTQTMSTRGASLDSRRVIVQQRLHEQDLTGVCLQLGGYDHLCLRMRFEGKQRATSIGWQDWREKDGELLCPQLYSLRKIEEIESILGPYGTAGQLQQRPVPRTGGMFKVDQFTIVDAVPSDGIKWVRSWDTAANNTDGNYTAGVLIGKHLESGKYYIADVQHDRLQSDDRMRMQRQTAELDSMTYGNVAQIQQQEPGSGGKDQSVAFVRLMAGFNAKCFRETGPKEVRADAYSAQVNAGNVLLLRAAWNKAYIDEHRVAPNGDNDDQWDAAASGFNYLENRTGTEFLPKGWTFGAILKKQDEAVQSSLPRFY